MTRNNIDTYCVADLKLDDGKCRIIRKQTLQEFLSHRSPNELKDILETDDSRWDYMDIDDGGEED